MFPWTGQGHINSKKKKKKVMQASCLKCNGYMAVILNSCCVLESLKMFLKGLSTSPSYLLPEPRQ